MNWRCRWFGHRPVLLHTATALFSRKEVLEHLDLEKLLNGPIEVCLRCEEVLR